MSDLTAESTYGGDQNDGEELIFRQKISISLDLIIRLRLAETRPLVEECFCTNNTC